MGLDSIEILMEVENAFGIKIPDSEAEKIITVGDFHNSVWKHLEGRQVDTCHSQVLFYKLRSDLAAKNSLDRSVISPRTSPEKLWPLSERRQAYKQFESELGLSLPPLELPNPWSDLLTWTSVALIAGSLLAELILINFFDYSAWIWLWTIVTIGFVFGISELIEPLRTKVSHSDMRAFTMQVLKDNYRKLVGESGTNRREMEILINQIIADKVGLDILEIDPDKRIADDLGVD